MGKKECKSTVLEGLSRLEYRGYDSVGFVCVDKKHLHLSFCKEAGSVDKLKLSLSQISDDGFIGMGHTRWATHGAAKTKNAHPHLNSTNTIAVIHNGIIEDHHKIRNYLTNKGYEFRSETDTEVVIHLFDEAIKLHKTIHEAIGYLVKKINGIYALAFIMEKNPKQLILIRKKSPLAIGIGDGEMFVSSDPVAFSGKTQKVLFLPEESFALVSPDSVDLYDFNGKKLHITTQNIDFKFTAANKDGFEHYMLKEIYEQKEAINKTISFYKEREKSGPIWGQLGISSETVKSLKSMDFVAAGTSWHAGKIAQFFFEEICEIPTNIHLASEFRYKKFFPPQNTAFVMISQSGETADTLECLRYVNYHKIPTIALTNVVSSTMVREAGGFLLTKAGPEISIASTKAFTSQLASLYWLANRMALEIGKISKKEMAAAEENIFVAAQILESCIENNKWEIVNNLAEKYSKFQRFIFLGRNIGYPLAMESALKLKEISYTLAQAYPGGELKHGPIALIDPQTPVIVFSLLDDLIYQKLLSNVQEIKARDGHIVAFAFEGQEELIELADKAFIIPKISPLLAPLAMSGLMQFFVYNISKKMGNSIDKPRNLAKSVTVE